MTTIHSFYAISARDKAHGRHVFLAIYELADAHSGGYPYWSDNVLVSKRFESSQQALEYRNVPSFSGDVSNPCITFISIDAETQIDLGSWVDQQKAELEKEIKKLKEQVAAKEQQRDAL